MRSNPLIYEVNAWLWLKRWQQRLGIDIGLGEVPEEALTELTAAMPDVVWLMGVWRRSAAGVQQALTHLALQQEYRSAVPDVRATDISGSPYAIGDYQVAPELGGEDSLQKLRRRLSARGIKLMLDLVPNHVAIDHPWLLTNPDAFIQASAVQVATQTQHHDGSRSYFVQPQSGQGFAHGRDPYFPPWTDTAQLDAQSVVYRRLLTQRLQHMTTLCDGVRCDMAMLLVQRIFARTWGSREGRLTTELWPEVIGATRAVRPDFVFAAEVYWDMESELQGMGFDYTYDKRLYDRLVADDRDGVRDHLLAQLSYQQHLLRFVENHDEPRAMTALGSPRFRAAAALSLSLPGARLVFMGQLEGRRTKLPVQLAREPLELPDPLVRDFYRRLLAALRDEVFHDGQFFLLGNRPYLGKDRSHENLLAHAWRLEDQLRVVVCNLGPHKASGRVALPPLPSETHWRFVDLLHDNIAPVFSAQELCVQGLPIFLDGYDAHVFEVLPAHAGGVAS